MNSFDLEIVGNVMMLEADVLLRGQDTENETNVPIMAHPPAIDSDNTLEEWIDTVVKTNRGMKLDFKYTNVLEHALKILHKKKNLIKQPLWLNSDIFTGPNAIFSFPVNSTEFKRIVLKYFPESTLSIGWTTGWINGIDNEVYTRAMINQMIEYCKDIKQPITFPVRAAMVKASWGHLSHLLNQSRSYSLTIWSSKNDDVDPDDMVFVRKNSEISRIYYDLPEQLMREFLKRLQSGYVHVTSISSAVTPMWYLLFLGFILNICFKHI